MNHKRKRPKMSRAGCLLCKPHKRNGVNKERYSVKRKTLDKPQDLIYDY